MDTYPIQKQPLYIFSSHTDKLMYGFHHTPEEKGIEGILLDRFTLWFILGNFSLMGHKKGDSSDMDTSRHILAEKMTRTAVEFHPETLFYGVLVKDYVSSIIIQYQS